MVAYQNFMKLGYLEQVTVNIAENKNKKSNLLTQITPTLTIYKHLKRFQTCHTLFEVVFSRTDNSR